MTITDTVHFLVLAYTFFAVVFYSRSKLHIEKKRKCTCNKARKKNNKYLKKNQTYVILKVCHLKLF